MSNSGTEQNVLFYYNSVIIVIVVLVIILILETFRSDNDYDYDYEICHLYLRAHARNVTE